jgi:hypothetical protein
VAQGWGAKLTVNPELATGWALPRFTSSSAFTHRYRRLVPHAGYIRF